MTTAIAPQTTVTFTVKKVPRGISHRKTIERLMRMNPSIQKGLRKLARRRRQSEIVAQRRAGRLWLSRPHAPKLIRLEPGESFTLTITPQIMPDIRSVEKYLDVKKAKRAS